MLQFRRLLLEQQHLLRFNDYLPELGFRRGAGRGLVDRADLLLPMHSRADLPYHSGSFPDPSWGCLPDTGHLFARRCVLSRILGCFDVYRLRRVRDFCNDHCHHHSSQ